MTKINLILLLLAALIFAGPNDTVIVSVTLSVNQKRMVIKKINRAHKNSNSGDTVTAVKEIWKANSDKTFYIDSIKIVPYTPFQYIQENINWGE